MRYLERAIVRMLGVLAGVIRPGLVGCGGDDDEANPSGNYQGTMQDSLAGTGAMTATLDPTQVVRVSSVYIATPASTLVCVTTLKKRITSIRTMYTALSPTGR